MIALTTLTQIACWSWAFFWIMCGIAGVLSALSRWNNRKRGRAR